MFVSNKGGWLLPYISFTSLYEVYTEFGTASIVLDLLMTFAADNEIILHVCFLYPAFASLL